ncbi:hypothetical protein G6L97_26840 (plasmid) [Agrobacterium tumefaciens]|uniref:hypothetical protein n=1 Tax=Agrobacterium tumefaciens TaxID=358 RepID=UPI001573A3E1|nr:hypothetical protein [Agrobacterium tumefaciens]NSZ87613.1 hypothetical protein [Agrobacterium tumefaciens]WCA72938.1 hypothetical protein G6L97_26840 [Agrobacterium tumefaciens]
MDTAVKRTHLGVRGGLQEAFDLILKGRGRSDTPGKSLKCIGLFTVILRLRALDETVTRQTLARETGLTENAIAPHVRYLESLGLVTMTLARAQNSIAREFHINAEDALIEYTRKAIAKNRHRAFAKHGNPSNEHREKFPQDVQHHS